jgi:hypothetical protein
MKYVITESQHRQLIKEMNEETIKKVSTNWFKRQIERGEDPHIDGDLLMFLGIKKYSTAHDRLLRSLREFLGEGIYEAADNRVSKVFDTSDYPEISGGYDFQFKVNIVDRDMNQLLLGVDVLPGGEVDLIMTDGGVRDLKDAMFDDEIGMEIYHESADVIYRIIEQEITDYTGFDYVVEDINYI